MSSFTGGPLTEEEEYLLERFKILREKVFYLYCLCLLYLFTYLIFVLFMFSLFVFFKC